MVPVDAEDLQAEYDRLRVELGAYSQELAATPFCVGLTKIDLLPTDEPLPALVAEGALGVYGFSAVARRGINELLEALWDTSRAVAAEERKGGEDEEWWSP